MMLGLQKRITRQGVTVILLLLFFVSLICAFRAVTSITTGLLLFAGLFFYHYRLQGLFSTNARKQFTIGCILFFSLQLVSFLSTHHVAKALSDIRIKSGLVFLPLALLSIGRLKPTLFRKLCYCYCLILVLACLFLITAATREYLASHILSSFFFHDLVRPFRYHAVYFSILVFAGLLFLLEELFAGNAMFRKAWMLMTVLFLSLFLLLLASKLVISFYTAYLIYSIIKWGYRKKINRRVASVSLASMLMLAAVILITRNPLGYRFRDILHGNISLIEQPHFSPAVYFNGVQFRLLEWKLIPEILTENKAWLTGVTPGDAQNLLNQKYLEKNMYSGAAGRDGLGYLGYNSHCELLEALLQNGIAGAISFVFIFISLIHLMLNERKTIVTFTILLLLFYSLIESIFQEQYGIVIFTFFPLFLSIEGESATTILSHPKPVHSV